jgi:hypothetical protein
LQIEFLWQFIEKCEKKKLSRLITEFLSLISDRSAINFMPNFASFHFTVPTDTLSIDDFTVSLGKK